MTRVLLVDDNPVVVAVYRSGPSMAGFTVDTATDGAAALAKAAATTPDLIVLDLMLPVVDGFEVLRRVRADAALMHVPVIVFSNWSTCSTRSSRSNRRAALCRLRRTRQPRPPRELFQQRQHSRQFLFERGIGRLECGAIAAGTKMLDLPGRSQRPAGRQHRQ